MTIATSAFPSSTSRTAVVSRHAARVKETIRAGRSRATIKQSWDFVRNLAKKVLTSGRSQCIEHTTALIIDLAHRGHLEDAEAIGHEFIAIARAEHAAKHGEPVQLSVDEAHIAEEIAEGEVEVAETAMARANTPTNRIRYLQLAARHERARTALDAAVRRENARSGA